MSFGRRHLRPAFAVLLTAALAFPPVATAQAEGTVLVALGRWQVKDGQAQLVVPLTDALTAKQRSIIGGGFTTVSQLSLRQPRAGADDADEEDMPLFYGVRCSVKFDAWEETYDVARLDEQPKTALVKDYSAYGDLCLKAEVTDPARLSSYAKGGTLLAFLIVKQTSVEEASKIKEWLVQQQSGVMQSLFSHMLGELTLNQTVRVKVSIPPKPQGVELGKGD